MKIEIRDNINKQLITTDYKGERDYFDLLIRLRACHEYNLIDSVSLDHESKPHHMTLLTHGDATSKPDYYIRTVGGD